MHKTYYAMSTFPNFFHFMSIFKELRFSSGMLSSTVSQRTQCTFQVTQISQHSMLFKIITLSVMYSSYKGLIYDNSEAVFP